MRDAILDALTTIGPMSLGELVGFTGASSGGASKAMADLRRLGQAHLRSYDRGGNGVRRKPIQIFAAGPGRDAEFKRLPDAEYTRRKRAKRAVIDRARRAANQGVFGLMVEQLGRAE